METLEIVLSEHPFFQGMSPEYLKVIAGCATNVRFDTGDYIFREGEEANRFYVIRHGKVAVEITSPEKGTITVQTISEGDVLGWSWLIPPHRWRFDAKALDLVRAIALDGRCLRGKCEEMHNLGYELLKRFTAVTVNRLEATRLQLLDVYHTRSR
jgi:CRP-like cAMP-binding protein